MKLRRRAIVEPRPTGLALLDGDLPGFFQDADRAAKSGQRRYLVLSATRFVALVAATAAGTLTFTAFDRQPMPTIAAVAVGVAFVTEVVLWVSQPERDWYAGRALAESTKTLAWRYASCGNPFPAELLSDESQKLLFERVADVTSKGKDRITLSSSLPLVTPEMAALRSAGHTDRRRVYVRDRTVDQMVWYATNAKRNKTRATFCRVLLVLGEAGALIAAILRASGEYDVDVAGIVAGAAAAVAAWFALKQYSQLASAYSMASTELALQRALLASTIEDHWAEAVAGAEEAISREHIMWLASRGPDT
ncbi:DUF4231 domain-containing protein [Aeromicrobium yanjiei]|nr:DUF4231 domain-containing protein [Aeromicrobium yanjiei]